MKIIIPMAGAGSRFKQAGIVEEKYEIRIKDRTMFEYALLSLTEFFDESFVFVTRSDHESIPFVAEKCQTLGIEKYDVVEVDGLTAGQAETAIRAKQKVEPNEPILIYNIDTYVESKNLSPTVLGGDGSIPVFRTEGGNWSYVELDDRGHAANVSEKEPISNLASLGLYHFSRFELFDWAYRELAVDVEREYSERYVAPMYNWLIERGYSITVPEIPRSAVNVLGTPNGAARFDPEFPDRYRL